MAGHYPLRAKSKRGFITPHQTRDGSQSNSPHRANLRPRIKQPQSPTLLWKMPSSRLTSSDTPALNRQRLPRYTGSCGTPCVRYSSLTGKSHLAPRTRGGRNVGAAFPPCENMWLKKCQCCMGRSLDLLDRGHPHAGSYLSEDSPSYHIHEASSADADK